MRFSEIVKQARDLLQGKGRISCRALKMEFDLADEQLDVLKEELIDADRVAVDEDGKRLVWVGNSQGTSVSLNTPPQPQPPASYAPPHLAERILAEQAAMEARGTL